MRLINVDKIEIVQHLREIAETRGNLLEKYRARL